MIKEIKFFGIDYIGEETDLKKFDTIIWDMDEEILEIIEDNKKESHKQDNYILWNSENMA